jgi:NADH-quinone oxidoreductase subunit A
LPEVPAAMLVSWTVLLDHLGMSFVALSRPSFYLRPSASCANPRRVATQALPHSSHRLEWRRRDSPGARAAGNGKSNMNELISSYLPVVIFIAVAMVVGLALITSPFIVAYRNPDPEKLSAYECGFDAFDDARMKFDIRFYLVSILFIIFDLEVAFLFPWAVSFSKIGWLGFWSMMVFLAVLTIGFIYEWKKGALEWD